jgi:hypothetical protein
MDQWRVFDLMGDLTGDLTIKTKPLQAPGDVQPAKKKECHTARDIRAYSDRLEAVKANRISVPNALEPRQP